MLDSAERRAFAGAGRAAGTPSSMGQQQRGHGGFTPSSRGGFSLADMLDGRAMAGLAPLFIHHAILQSKHQVKTRLN